MKAFLSHAHEDKGIVESVGSWLTVRGVEVWIDTWRLTPGDSLVDKIGEGIEASDRLVVFLSAASVDSKWVRKEVATGLVMEQAEEKGLGRKFVIPALLTPCKVPILLRAKLYANFTNKAFEAACEELHRGILDQPTGPQDTRYDNGVVRTYSIKLGTLGKNGLLVEFAVRMSPTEGLHVDVDVGAPYETVRQWFGVPNNPMVMPGGGLVTTDSSERREPPIYARRFSSPGITSSKSFYLYFEADRTLELKQWRFRDFYDRDP